MPQHQPHQPLHRDDRLVPPNGQDAGERFYPATVVARLAQRDLSTIHRWCRIGFLVGAIRGTGPGRQPWLIPAAEGQRVAMTTGIVVATASTASPTLPVGP